VCLCVCVCVCFSVFMLQTFTDLLKALLKARARTSLTFEAALIHIA
jgi:hypothetical protein